MIIYYIIIHIHIYIYITWINYNDLTATSLEWWLVRGIIPKWHYLRLVNYCYLPRYMYTRTCQLVRVHTRIDACTRITVDPTDGIAKKNSVQPSLYVNLCTETISVYIHVTITTKLLNLHVGHVPPWSSKNVYHQMWLDKMPVCNCTSFRGAACQWWAKAGQSAQRDHPT